MVLRAACILILTVLTSAAVIAEVPIDDPGRDGWSTEVFNSDAGGQLSRLGKLLEHPADMDAGDVAMLAAEDFACRPLRPDEAQVFEDGSARVSRGGVADQGNLDLFAALQQLTEPWRDAQSIRIKFKLFRVTPDEQGVTTTQYFSLFAQMGDALHEINATWDIRWAEDSQTDPPRLRSIVVKDYEHVVTPRLMFQDCTASLLGDVEAYEAQLLYDMDHWLTRFDLTTQVDPEGKHGIAIGDADGDGLDDVYYCETGGLPNRLLLQNPDGTLRDVSAQAGVDFLDRTRSALFVDLDNDDDQDLVLGTHPNLTVMENVGNARFRPRAAISDALRPMSICAADYDNDGDVDIYVCMYYDSASGTIGHQRPLPYHDANNGHPNVLLRNDGRFGFTDVTAQVGLDQNNQRFSYAAQWEDIDNDGDMDLYVANDFGRNNLYRNDGGRFTDIAASAGVEDISAGMSVSFGDVDNDGDMDLYVANMFSSAGNRITYQRHFNPSAVGDDRAQYQRHARGNSLFINQGDATFRDASDDAHVTMGRWAWASKFIDINNDARLDIAVANGFITAPNPDDL